MEGIKRKRKIAGALIVVVGLVLGIVIGVFLLPILFGNNGLNEDYVRIEVFVDSSTHRSFNDSPYTFVYRGQQDVVDPEPIEIVLQGSSETLPAVAGRTYNVLGISVVVSEVYDDHVVLLVKPA